MSFLITALTQSANKPQAELNGTRPTVPPVHTGRRDALVAATGSDKPSLRLLLLHDDNEREFDYTSGTEQALEVAGKNGWTIVSMKTDWATIF